MLLLPMSRLSRLLLLVWLAILCGSWTAESTTILADAAERINPRQDSQAVLKVSEFENNVAVRSSEYLAWFKGQDKLLLQESSPEKDRGRAVLVAEHDLRVGLPAARNPLQIPAEQRWSSDVAFADMARADFVKDYNIEAITKEKIDHSQAIHYSLARARPSVPFSRVELWISSRDHRPVKATFVSIDGHLRRTCKYLEFRNLLGEQRPTRFVFTEDSRPTWAGELVFTDWSSTTLGDRFFVPSVLDSLDGAVAAPSRPDSRAPSANQPLSTFADMVAIPGGKAIMGRNEGFLNERPEHEVQLQPYLLDRYEVSNRQYRAFLRAQPVSRYKPYPPYTHSLPRSYFTDARFDSFPVVGVSWYAAAAFCHWRGARLPTEAEWEHAARGTDNRIYPWGNLWAADKANYRDISLSSIAQVHLHFTTPVGALESPGPYGTYDMAGNAAEWTADWYLPYPGSPATDADFGRTLKVVRGGSWLSGPLTLTTVARGHSEPAYGYDSIGFRCAKDDLTANAAR